MSVRAKFKCQSVSKNQYNEVMFDVLLFPVYGDSDPNSENSRYWKWTPAGQVLLSTVNAAAAEQFKEGEEYYVDFTRATPA